MPRGRLLGPGLVLVIGHSKDQDQQADHLLKGRLSGIGGEGLAALVGRKGG